MGAFSLIVVINLLNRSVLCKSEMGGSSSSLSKKTIQPVPWENDLKQTPTLEPPIEAVNIDARQTGSILTTAEKVYDVETDERIRRIGLLSPNEQFLVNSFFPSALAVFLGGVSGGRIYRLLRAQMGLGNEFMKRTYMAGLMPAAAFPAMGTFVGYKFGAEEPLLSNGTAVPKDKHVIKSVISSSIPVAVSPVYLTSLCIYLGMAYDVLDARDENMSMRKSMLTRYKFWFRKTFRTTLSLTMLTAVYIGIISSLQYDIVARTDNEKNLMPVDFPKESLYNK